MYMLNGISTLKKRSLLTLIVLLSSTSACSNLTAMDAQEKQSMIDDINHVSVVTIDKFSEKNPNFKDMLDASRGYMVADISTTKVPLVGKAKGVGAIYDNQDDSVTYVNLHRDDIGIGIGHAEYQIVSVFENEESLEVFRKGLSSSKVSADWNFTEGSLSSYDVNVKGQSVPTYTLKDGNQLSLAASFVDIEKNLALTDTGISNTTVSMKGRSKDKVTPVKHWDRALPFFGQQVIELGHDLPLPIGVSFIYASTNQNMELYDLRVKNKEGDYVPIDFVAFENNNNESITPQIKFDAWVFPFMNVFVSIGRIEGEANVNFGFDKNALTNQLGIDCTLARGKEKRFCESPQLVDGVVDVVAKMEGKSYTVGTVLAGGWDNYFFSLPISFTAVDMDDRNIDGHVFTASPRIGRVFSFQGGSSLAVYAGASYMSNEVRIEGSQDVGDTGYAIEYDIWQRTEDNWEPLVGANYNFNQKWSAFFEFTGSHDGRQQFTGGLTRRF